MRIGYDPGAPYGRARAKESDRESMKTGKQVVSVEILYSSVFMKFDEHSRKVARNALFGSGCR